MDWFTLLIYCFPPKINKPSSIQNQAKWEQQKKNKDKLEYKIEAGVRLDNTSH